ncbi:MAG: class I SAM-dependent methyltransferase [Polyangiaceae bacterium]
MTDVRHIDAHSALYFGDTRDEWWNLDHLRLLVARWSMSTVTDVLDVGAGVGHWGRLLSQALPSALRLTGVEREPRWVHEATQRAQPLPPATHPQTKLEYVLGDAMHLPFADASFDLVTCQTVLIHLPNPRACIAEMARVLRPRGHLLLVEPNNIAGQLASRVAAPLDDIDDVLRETRFQLICERGKAKLGLGFNSLGESLPGLIDATLFADIDIAQCDRPSPLLPPYSTRAQRAEVDEERDLVEHEIYMWPRAEAKRYYEAGGGTSFEDDYAFGLSRARARLSRIQQNELIRVGGQLQYLVHAIRR